MIVEEQKIYHGRHHGRHESQGEKRSFKNSKGMQKSQKDSSASGSPCRQGKTESWHHMNMHHDVESRDHQPT